MRVLLVVVMVLSAMVSQAQKGNIRGVVYDEGNGDPLIGVTVAVVGTATGAVTDLDGKFNISVEPGTHSLGVSYISYQGQTIEGVEVKAGEVTTLNNIVLKQASLEVAEVVVKAEMVRTNEAAMMLMKEKSPAMLDGISSEKMELIGDATAVEAAKRVTGVTIEGGKYVYVRGLGDRYSKTTLNGMDIPGLDPDRNSLQMDIFPSNLIQNITVSKNFTADMPADFTGGMMNIETKDFPDRQLLNLSVGVGYNPSMHFNSNYLTYNGGSTDFLGFDDGTRALPGRATQANIPTPISGAPDAEVNSFIREFNPTLGATRQMSPMDYSASFTYGDQFVLGKDTSGNDRSLGVILSLSYRSEYRYFSDVKYGEYQRFSNPNLNDMRYATTQEGEMGEQSVLLGGIAGLAYKTRNSKIKLTAMHLQSGESRAAKFDIDNDGAAVGQSGYIAYSDNLEYNQRSITNALLSGSHVLKNGWEVDWKASPTYSISEDPDIRKTAYTVTPVDTFFSAGAGGNPSRIWRSLSEINFSARADASKKYKVRGRDAKLQFGFSHTYKQRDYEILFYDVQFFGNQDWPNPDPSTVLDPSNIYDGTVGKPNNIYYQSGNSNPNPNEYASNINNTGLYVSNEMELFKRLKTIIGLRMEYYVQRHTGRDQVYSFGDVVNGRNLSNDKVLETVNFFPSVNLIYSLAGKQNLRFAYSRTVARPSFKELSFAQILDPITNRIFNGSLFTYTNQDGETTWDGNLQETDIDNLDIRWERFAPRGQMYSVSAFFKHFANPIEMVRIPEQQTSTEFQPRNVGTGYVFGLELEFRKSLEFITSALSDLSVNANVTIAFSALEMSDIEYQARKKFERTEQAAMTEKSEAALFFERFADPVNQPVTRTRQMAGQSPYVVNAGFAYGNRDLGLDVGVFYNVKGPTLQVVGIGLYPDAYTEPFHSLNFSINKKFGKEQRTSVDLRVSNALNDRQEVFYRSFEADKEVFSSFNPGVAVGLGFSHKF